MSYVESCRGGRTWQAVPEFMGHAEWHHIRNMQQYDLERRRMGHCNRDAAEAVLGRAVATKWHVPCSSSEDMRCCSDVQGADVAKISNGRWAHRRYRLVSGLWWCCRHGCQPVRSRRPRVHLDSSSLIPSTGAVLGLGFPIVWFNHLTY